MTSSTEGFGEFKLLFGESLEDTYVQFHGSKVMCYDHGEVQILPNLPNAASAASAAVVGETIYAIVAGQLMQLQDKDSSKGWERVINLPIGEHSQMGLVSLQKRLYLFGMGVSGAAAYYLQPTYKKWVPISAAPYDLRHYTALSCGNDHLLFFSTVRPQSEILAYYRTTDSWFQIGRLPQPMQVLLVGSDETQFTLYGVDRVLCGQAVLRPTKYGWIDHGVVAILIFLLVGVGSRFSKRGNSSHDYFRGVNAFHGGQLV